MKRRMCAQLFLLLLTFAAIIIITTGCTTTTTQKGAGIGAAAGALIGQAAGRDTKSTIIGATAGGLTGALVSDAVQQRKIAKEKAGQEAAQARSQLETQQSQSAQPVRTATTYPAGQYQVDPTAGEFVNNTRWNIRVYVDAPTNDLKKAPQLSLGPNETAPANLDIGKHRVSAIAYVNTQYGERMVGSYENVLNIEPRGQGWKVAFNEGSFR